MKTLDKKSPFGEIHGKHELGAKYEQNGVLFDADGKQIEKKRKIRKREKT